MAKLKDGFYKQTAEAIGSDLYVLLAGGGSKPLSDFATNSVSGNYVTLDTAQTISGVKTFNAGNIPIRLNSTGNEVGIQFLLNDTAKGWVGHTNTTGTYIYNYPSAKYIGVKDDGTPYYYSGGFKTLLHADNYTDYTLSIISLSNSTDKLLSTKTWSVGSTTKGDQSSQSECPTLYGMYMSLQYNTSKNQGYQFFGDTWADGRLYVRYRKAGDSNTTYNAWQSIAFISDIPTSLPANGGNADTVDGYHASDIYGYIKPDDLNNVVKSDGIATSYYDYATSAKVINQPTGDNVSDARGVITFGRGYPFQLSWRYNSAASLYARTRYNNSWNSWVRIAVASDIPTVTNYYWANINITSSPDSTKIPTLGGLITTGAIQSSSNYPVWLTSIGTGTYNKTVITHSADGLIIERARKTESSSGVIIPLTISQRGGGDAVTFKNNDVLVSGRVESTENCIWESGTKYRITSYGYQGIGRIYNYNEETTKYGDLYLGYNGANGITIKGDTFNVGIGTDSPTQKLSVNGAIYTMQPSSNRQAGIIGTYDPNRAAAIWSMGAAYQIAAGGTTLGSLYGAAYVYYGSGYTFGAGKSGGHSFVWAQNGNPTVALGDYVWAANGFLKANSSNDYVLLGGGDHKQWNTSSSANTLVARDANQYIYATYYNSAISDENSLTLGSVYVRNNSDNWIRRMAYSTFAGKIAESLDSRYVKTHEMMNSAYACIPTYNGETGWHRIATIKGSVGCGSYILYLCGTWSWASNTNAIIHIDTMHTTAQLTQVSGIVGYVNSIRLVNINGNEYYVDVHINYTGANTPGSVHCYFLGNGTITPRTTAEKITASVTASAELFLANGGFSHASAALKDTNNGKNITACYSTGGFSSNPSWLAAWNGYHLTYVSPSVLNVNYATTAGNANTLDGIDSTGFFISNKGSVSVPYIDLTTYTSNHSDYKNYDSGTYTVSRTGYSDTYIVFKSSGSTSAIELMSHYEDTSRLKLRKTIDSNRVSGPWRELAFTSDIPAVTDYYWADQRITSSVVYTASPTLSTLRVQGSDGGRGTIYMVSASDVPNDLWFGAGGQSDWSLSSRSSSEGRYFGLYNNSLGWAFQVDRSNNRFKVSEWIQFDNRSGLYWPNTYGAHFYPNETSTYGQFQLLGTKGSYSGIHFGNSKNYLTVMSTDTHHGLYCETNGWEFYYNRSNTYIGLRTSTTPYPISMEGDSYTTGWSRAASGFYVEGQGVHYMASSIYGIGQIYLTNNEFNWGASNADLYFNYRAATSGTTVTNYIWNAGSSSSYATHTMGLTYFRGSGKYLRIGPQNSSHAHYETDADTSHWFNKMVEVNGVVRPYSNNSFTSGDSNKRWSNVYSYLGNFAGTVSINCAYPNIVCNNNASGASEATIRFDIAGVNKGYIGYNTNCGTYLWNSKASKYVYIADTGYFYTQSYIYVGSGNEKNASNPPYVWGVNGSDNFMRTYATSSLSVGKAINADYAISAPAAANWGGTGSTTKIKVKINSTTSWMLSFVVTIYQGYRASKIMISGYNYGTSYWYEPEAVLLGDSNGATSVPVYFGYDSAWNLWVGFDGDAYTGVSISDVTNGYTQITNLKDLFTISNVSSLSTTQKTVTATNSVNYATTSGTANSVAWTNITDKPTIPTKTSQLTNDSGFITSRGYIGTTTVSSSSNAGQNITGIGNITPNSTESYKLGTSDKQWYQIFSKYFTSGKITLRSSYNADTAVNTGYLEYTSTNGYFYITANSIAAGTSGGFVMKTTKNGVVSQILLESASVGQVKLTGNTTVTGTMTISGDLKANNGVFYTNSTGAYHTSDIRKKTNITKARNLSIADLLVEFDWKDSGKHSWGYIAQELLEVLPEAVDYNEDVYSVNYNVAHSAAIASLTARIKELEEKLKKYGLE